MVNIRITILSGVIMHLHPSSEHKSDEERSSRFLQNAGVHTCTRAHIHTHTKHNNNKSQNTKKLAVIFSCPVFEGFNSFYSQEIISFCRIKCYKSQKLKCQLNENNTRKGQHSCTHPLTLHSCWWGRVRQLLAIMHTLYCFSIRKLFIKTANCIKFTILNNQYDIHRSQSKLILNHTWA